MKLPFSDPLLPLPSHSGSDWIIASLMYFPVIRSSFSNLTNSSLMSFVLSTKRIHRANCSTLCDVISSARIVLNLASFISHKRSRRI